MILQESIDIIRISQHNLIVETKHGFICANAGIDKSNVSIDEDFVLLLPENPDLTANQIRQYLYNKLKKKVAIIISDTFGRPFRNGQTNIAIGIAGINAIKSYIGHMDLFGKILKVTEIAIVDELSAAAELVMGKISGVPAVIIRGYDYEIADLNLKDEQSSLSPSQSSESCSTATTKQQFSSQSIKSLIRDKSKDLFRN